MSLNSFGRLFRFSTWGESHGPAIGAVVDGCPPLIPLDEGMVQAWLDRRRPGQSRHTSQRREPDEVEILSGVLDGKTTGTPIHLMIRNRDQRSKDYSEIEDRFRPGHADITYWQKYGARDHRGGGRASARETACRVAAGGVARAALAVLAPRVSVHGYLVQMGEKTLDRANFSLEALEASPLNLPDAGAADEWESYLDGIRKDGNSVGAVVEVVARGVPPGLGAPLYGKLDADLASAMMSINAVKGVEIGAGMGAAALTGLENADEIAPGPDGVDYRSNNAGGVLGGISTGQDVVVRFAVKPTSSILKPRQTVTKSNEPATVITKGRHDPCVGIRAVPVGEAMMACVLLDHFLMHRGQVGTPGGSVSPPGGAG